ncbi:hypothetical protein SHVI106290_03495 [Shewanella violacea]
MLKFSIRGLFNVCIYANSTKSLKTTYIKLYANQPSPRDTVNTPVYSPDPLLKIHFVVIICIINRVFPYIWHFFE